MLLLGSKGQKRNLSKLTPWRAHSIRLLSAVPVCCWQGRPQLHLEFIPLSSSVGFRALNRRLRYVYQIVEHLLKKCPVFFSRHIYYKFCTVHPNNCSFSAINNHHELFLQVSSFHRMISKLR